MLVLVSVFWKMNLREVWDENGQVLIQMRVTGSLPIIYRKLTENFPKIFQIFSGSAFGLIPTKLGFEWYFISFPKICRQLYESGVATYENSYKNRSHFFNFRAMMYLFGKDVVYLISSNKTNLNNRKVNINVWRWFFNWACAVWVFSEKFSGAHKIEMAVFRLQTTACNQHVFRSCSIILEYDFEHLISRRNIWCVHL